MSTKELLKLLAMNLHVQNYCNDASLVILVSALNRTADALPDTPPVPKSDYDALMAHAEAMAEAGEWGMAQANAYGLAKGLFTDSDFREDYELAMSKFTAFRSAYTKEEAS